MKAAIYNPYLDSLGGGERYTLTFAKVLADNGKSLFNKMKLFRVNSIICNSYFTKDFIDKEYGVDSIVIYPPVDTDKIKPARKENIILYVGRFSQLEQTNNQHILVDRFKKFFNKGYKDWKLVLAGW